MRLLPRALIKRWLRFQPLTVCTQVRVVLGEVIDTNQDVAEKVLALFLCPSDPSSEIIDRSCGTTSGPKMARSNYAGVEGTERMALPCWDDISNLAAAFFHPQPVPCRASNGLFYLNSFTQFRNVTDGTSHTLAVGEVSGQLNQPKCICCPDSSLGGIVWAGVHQAYRSDQVLAITNDELNDSDGDGHSLGFSSQHQGGVQFLFVDGHVQFLKENIDNQPGSPGGVYQWLSTISGGEVISDF